MGDTPTPADIFRLLADDIRVDILEALALAQYESAATESGPTELTFSDIYERTDVENTSKLSYHLGELEGPLLRKGDDGYSFTHGGEKFVRLILSDNYEQPPGFTPIETGGECMYCGCTALEAKLKYQYFFVTCSDCKKPLSGHPVAPALVRAYDGSELVEMIAKKMALDYRQIRTGFCLACSGTLSTTVVDTAGLPIEDIHSFLVVDECTQCLREYSGPMVYGVAYHPASVAFHWEHGVDLSTKGMWEFHQYRNEWTATQLSTDPAEYRVIMPQESEELHVYLDANVSVTRTERVRNRTVE